jgi:pimeloyl-ACP methyl ester carboxylesterase
MDTYADDLLSLLDSLNISTAVLCGLSWGGGIAQVFAVRNPDRLCGLVLASSSVSMSLTLAEKLLRYILFPRSAMMLVIRSLSVDQFVRFSFWLAGLTLGRDWLSRDQETEEYIRHSMLQINKNEYMKIWDSIYGFDLQPLEKIHCPTLVLRGEHDTKMVFRHTSEILRRIPNAEARILPSTFHAMTLEEPESFNRELELFLLRST